MVAFLFLAMASCQTMPKHYVSSHVPPGCLRVLVVPFKNISMTPDAGEAATALFVSAVTVYHPFIMVRLSPQEVTTISGMIDGHFLPEALRVALKRQNIDAVLYGNVTEYEYQAGLASEPVVGIDWTMVSTLTGSVLWTAAPTKLGWCFWFCHKTLSSLVRDIVDEEMRNLDILHCARGT